MNVINQTKKSILAESLVIPTSFMDQALGLLTYKTPTAMLFKTRYGIHTFGMKYPIDIVILDNQNRVAVLKKAMEQNRIFLWNIKYETVLELPAGTIEKTKTQILDIVAIRE